MAKRFRPKPGSRALITPLHTQAAGVPIFWFARQRQRYKSRGYCNRYTPLNDGKHESRNCRCPIDVP